MARDRPSRRARGPRGPTTHLQRPAGYSWHPAVALPFGRDVAQAAHRAAGGTVLAGSLRGERIVGEISLHISPTRWRMRHVASIGMAVRDDWQGKGVGTALMEAALELADNWLNLTRIELR